MKNTEATEAREIQCFRDCYTATTHAPYRKLGADRTDRQVHAAYRQGCDDWAAGRKVHVVGCTDH
jgi:hypothetical protein